MRQLLFALLLSEMGLVIVLSFKTPLRKLVIIVLDRVKKGRGPLMVKTVFATLSVVLASSVYTMLKIRKRWIGETVVNPTDQILLANHLLESTLMGASLFLAVTIDRLHHYIRELRSRRKHMAAEKKQRNGFEDKDEEDIKEEMKNMVAKFKQLESEYSDKTKEVDAFVSLRKQSEGFLSEYDRLLKENQKLRTKLQSLDRTS